MEENIVFFIESEVPIKEPSEGSRSGIDVGGSYGSVSQKVAAILQQKVAISPQQLRQQVTGLVAVVNEVFHQADQQAKPGMTLDEVELTVEVNAEGQIGILGNGGKASGKGGIKLKFKRQG
jgi:hypothetical protein